MRCLLQQWPGSFIGFLFLRLETGLETHIVLWQGVLRAEAHPDCPGAALVAMGAGSGIIAAFECIDAEEARLIGSTRASGAAVQSVGISLAPAQVRRVLHGGGVHMQTCPDMCTAHGSITAGLTNDDRISWKTMRPASCSSSALPRSESTLHLSKLLLQLHGGAPRARQQDVTGVTAGAACRRCSPA